MATSITENFAPGFDSSLAVSPAIVPVDGATVSLRVTADITDAVLAANMLRIYLENASNSLSVNEISLTDPTNLGGATVYDCKTAPCPSSPDSYSTWAVSDPQANRLYTFVATVAVANPPGPKAQPWSWSPYLDVGVDYGGSGSPALRHRGHRSRSRCLHSTVPHRVRDRFHTLWVRAVPR